MSSFLVYQKFTPEESNLEEKCIWCKKVQKKNKAHILSRKIIRENASQNVLKKTVCEKCNASIGSSIEDFLFKKTPLGYLADLFLHRELKTLKWIPNYYWSNSLGTWVVCVHDKNVGTDTLPNQVMVDADNNLITFLKNDINPMEVNEDIIKNIKSDLKVSNYTVYESSKYPDNFFPRAFYLKGKLILTGRNSLDLINLKQAIEETKTDAEYVIGKRGGKVFSDKYQINFKWDLKAYYDYCAKIAFEFFSLLAGQEVCLENAFDELRGIVTSYRMFKPEEVVLTEESSKITLSSKLLPEGWISYTELNDKVAIFPLTGDDDNLNHSISIYELDNGFVCATVKLFNIQTAQLILAKRKPSNHFTGWQIHYDIKTSEVSFFKSVNDKKTIDSLTTELSETLLKNSSIITSPELFWKKP